MLRQTWFPILLCLLLPACAARPPKLETPEIRIVELTMAQPGQSSSQSYQLTLRIRNTSEVEMIVSSYDLELVLDGSSAGMHTHQEELAIPILSTEISRSNGQLDPLQAKALVALQNGRRGQIPYTLKGVLNSQGRRFDLAYDGWLSRSPGKDGSFR
jgi:hypothetical protein